MVRQRTGLDFNTSAGIAIVSDFAVRLRVSGAPEIRDQLFFGVTFTY
jgi:hypothetical protein